MRNAKFSRRDVLKGSSALALTVCATPIRAQAPAASPVTPALIEAAKKEGKAVWYTSADLPLAERVARSFDAKYPGVAVRVERTGAERVFSRIGQEYASKIHAVDIVNSSDAAHFVWKRDGLLTRYVPEDGAKHYPAEHKDADGMFASFRIFLCPVAYNTNLVNREEVPRSYADLLDPKWTGKIVKAHPSYSGTILTATYQMTRDIGRDYFEKLARQRIMRCSRPPIRPRSSRSASARSWLTARVCGVPTQGKGRSGGSDRRHATDHRPGRDFQECAQSERRVPLAELHVFGRVPAALHRPWRLQSAHALTKEKAGRAPLSKIKLMKDDAAAVEKQGESIKRRYTQIFKV